MKIICIGRNYSEHAKELGNEVVIFVPSSKRNSYSYEGVDVKLMSNQPDVVAGLLVGTVAGVALLRGVPVGPLIAAGLLTLIIGTGQP